MIVILPLDGTPAEHFESYDALLECIMEIEHEKYSDDMPMDWRFTIYPLTEVAALYALSQEPCAAIEEAFEEDLPLIEICTGDYKKPLYIAMTPNVDMDYLKRKWCTDRGGSQNSDSVLSYSP